MKRWLATTRRGTCIAALVPTLAVVFAVPDANAAREERYGIEGKFIEYDAAHQTFKVMVTSNKWTGFGKSPAGGKAPKDIKTRTEMTLAVKPEGSVLSRTVIKSIKGTGLDTTGTQEGFNHAIEAIPKDKAITLSIARNPAAKTNSEAPAYQIKTVLIMMSEAELRKRWEEDSDEAE